MFYDKYAQLCKQRGVSMSAAAVEAGVSKSLVTKWKVNKVDVPSPDVLKKLSVYFGMPVSELLGEEEKEKPAPKRDELGYSDMELLDAYERADEATKKAIRLLLKVE